MNAPSWFSSIVWSAPLAVEALRTNRNWLPRLPGVYVFTNFAGPLEKSPGVLYVGNATSLFNRVQSYLVDPREMLVMSSRSGGQRDNSSLNHAGKAQLLAEIQQKSRGPSPSGICIRWSQTTSPASLEQLLLTYLRPAFNTHGVRIVHDCD